MLRDTLDRLQSLEPARPATGVSVKKMPPPEFPQGSPIISILSALGHVSAKAGSASYPGESIIWMHRARYPNTKRSVETVCVDVGATRQIGSDAALYKPQILVLTHDDEDHIGGYESFSRTGLATLEELWVPFEWGALAYTLAQPSLLHGAEAGLSSRPMSEKAAVDRLIRARSLSKAEAGVVVRDVMEILQRSSESALQAIQKLRSTEGLMEVIDSILEPGGKYESTYRHKKQRTAADRALRRASSLMTILASACRAGVKVRFFSVDFVTDAHETWKHVGRPGSATLLNAIEIGAPLSWREDSLQFAMALISLSVQNRRALCTMLWHEGEIDRGAIVWSDSSGEWLASTSDFEPVFRASISTAPHHASRNESHDSIWRVLQPRLRDINMICAGGHPKQIGVRDEFARLLRTRRRCTRCRHTDPPELDASTVRAVVRKQDVTFVGAECLC